MSSETKTNGPKSLHPLASLLRGFAVDFITGHDLSVVERIMAPSYCLHIGGHTLDGRDDQYLPPTAAQIEQFPGLCVTVHDVVYGKNAIAMQFTEHGASSRHEDRGATWRGITLFRTDGERLRWGWAEEDYFARKRQLATGVCDSVDPPHAMPWDMLPADPDTAVENFARSWLREPLNLTGLPDAAWLSNVGEDDPQPDELVDIHEVEIDELFSAGNRVAFHATSKGIYKGGYPDIDRNLIGQNVVTRSAGIITVNENRVVSAKITMDRLGLYRALRFGD